MAAGPTEYSRAPHGTLDHRVPSVASTKKPTGRKQMGRLIRSRNVSKSVEGARATSHKARKIAGSDVDQGSVNATMAIRISAGYKDFVGLKEKLCHIGLGSNPDPY